MPDKFSDELRFESKKERRRERLSVEGMDLATAQE